MPDKYVTSLERDQKSCKSQITVTRGEGLVCCMDKNKELFHVKKKQKKITVQANFPFTKKAKVE